MNDVNDELVPENLDATDAMADAGAGLVAELQDEIDSLQADMDSIQEELRIALDRVEALESAPVVAAAPAGDDELRALAATVRTAQRTGHPDAVTHMNALLNALGAV